MNHGFDKIMQERNSISINSSDSSTSMSTQLDYAIPASRIASLSSGEFVGMVADDPDNKIELKVFHSEIQNDHATLNREISNYKPLPMVRNVTHEEIQNNYNQIKEEVKTLISIENEKLQAEINQQKDQEDCGKEALSL